MINPNLSIILEYVTIFLTIVGLLILTAIGKVDTSIGMPLLATVVGYGVGVTKGNAQTSFISNITNPKTTVQN